MKPGPGPLKPKKITPHHSTYSLCHRVLLVHQISMKIFGFLTKYSDLSLFPLTVPGFGVASASRFRLKNWMMGRGLTYLKFYPRTQDASQNQEYIYTYIYRSQYIVNPAASHGFWTGLGEQCQPYCMFCRDSLPKTPGTVT